MSTAEWFPPSVDASFERQSELDAKELFTSRPDILAHFYFDFYKQYCTADKPVQYGCILSLGEVASSIVIARQDYQQQPSHADTYLIKQYDLFTSEIHDWTVTDASVYQGRGDSFERTLLVNSTSQTQNTTQLHLSSKGNQWIVDSQAELLNSAHLLPFKAMHDLKLNETQLQEFYKTAFHQTTRTIGRAALFSVQ